MSKRFASILLLLLTLIPTGCVLLGGPLYQTYRRLQGEWTMDETWTSERLETFAKQNWGDPARNPRAKQEFKDLMEKSRQTSFIFNRRYLTVRQGKTETVERWSVMDYDSGTDTALIRTWGMNRKEEALNRNLSVQELVNILGVTDGDVPHVLGVRFLANGRVEFFTLKVVMGKVTDFKKSQSLQVYARGPIPKPTATPAPKPTATPIRPRPTPVIPGPTPSPTPIPHLVVPAPIPVLVFPTPTAVPGATPVAAVVKEKTASAAAVRPTATPPPAPYLVQPVGR